MTLSDDGIRVTINGQPVIDNLTYHAPSWNQSSIYLEANKDVAATIEAAIRANAGLLSAGLTVAGDEPASAED